jgi:hypothetical protein
MQDRGMIYGYARDSTASQDLAPHATQFKAAGSEMIVHKKFTGTTADCPRLRKLPVEAAYG